MFVLTSTAGFSAVGYQCEVSDIIYRVLYRVIRSSKMLISVHCDGRKYITTASAMVLLLCTRDSTWCGVFIVAEKDVVAIAARWSRRRWAEHRVPSWHSQWANYFTSHACAALAHLDVTLHGTQATARGVLDWAISIAIIAVWACAALAWSGLISAVTLIAALSRRVA